MKHPVVILFLALLFTSCARSPVKKASEAMRPASSPPEVISDDLNFAHLKEGLKANINEIVTSQRFTGPMTFGERQIPRKDYAQALTYLLNLLEQDPSGESFKKAIKENFEFYEIYGKKKWGEVFVTSYYVPEIRGSKRKTKEFTQPLYKTPKDLVNVDMGAYFERFPKLNVLEDVLEQKSRSQILRGRMVASSGGGLPKIVPYFDREAIDSKGSLKGQRLELAWVDPIEAFFLQIQGSGFVKLKNGKELRVGYHTQNGHPYRAIGRQLLDVIPLEEMSLQRIEAHLRSLPEEEQQEIFNFNPSYVFFQKLKTQPVGYFGTEVVPGRTVATDTRYFPKGALAYLEYEKPEFIHDAQTHPTAWNQSQRFVLDQDTGGAIRGTHRLDLYWGKGDKAKQVAGVMKNWGKLYYLLPKKEFLQVLLEATKGEDS